MFLLFLPFIKIYTSKCLSNIWGAYHSGVRTKSWTGRQSYEGSMYTEKEKEKAFGLYDKIPDLLPFRLCLCSTEKSGSQREKSSLKIYNILKSRPLQKVRLFFYLRNDFSYFVDFRFATLIFTEYCFFRCYCVFAERQKN